MNMQNYGSMQGEKTRRTRRRLQLSSASDCNLESVSLMEEK